MSDKLSDEQLLKIWKCANGTHPDLGIFTRMVIDYGRAVLAAASPAPAISESEDAAPSFASPLTPFGQLVRSLRVVTGALLGDMARAMGVSSAELSAIEFGKRPINPDQVKAISDFFENYGLPRTAPLLMLACLAARKENQS
ncbi:helix-turn-helix domain-containing protein [Burkholderia glumae]|uniref:helix-turn-helix domain-containing protein n=1 Tax=Burkholderia glumae TaxID=337 RepID=UPI00068D740F|nr:helix-turn-helix transcriptional regulator [Burkholderia glumae]